MQQEIAFEFGDSLVGYELDVLIDDQVDDETWIGRTFADAPEIDGAVFVAGTDLTPGEFLPVEIEARQDYDLWWRARQETQWKSIEEPVRRLKRPGFVSMSRNGIQIVMPWRNIANRRRSAPHLPAEAGDSPRPLRISPT